MPIRPSHCHCRLLLAAAIMAGMAVPAPAADDETLFGEATAEDFLPLQGVEFDPVMGEIVPASPGRPWQWTVLPAGLIYRSYLAGPKESRFSAVWFKEQDGLGWLMDATLGGRFAFLRFGDDKALYPEGWQVDFEGSAQLRLDFDEGPRLDLISTDYRYGIPLTYGKGPYQMKIAYYHISAHLGDEFSERNPAVARVNYVRDAIVWGHSYYLFSDLRIYGEAAYSFRTDGGAEPWEFQFGMEIAPPLATGPYGAPFLAINGLLQEEHDFGGIFTLQAGWAWRNRAGRVFRAGFQYLNGKSPQFEFFRQHEEQFGFGIWYDF